MNTFGTVIAVIARTNAEMRTTNDPSRTVCVMSWPKWIETTFATQDQWRRMSIPLKVFMVLMCVIGVGFLLYVPGLLVIIVAWSGYKWWRDNKRGAA